ncbi:MAG: F0F1 ATP synthase subunit delta [Rhodocyclaceae bacterium]|nr:F0F1 ATP synthase subunit delta [Rhodocyclaceae bacterium]
MELNWTTFVLQVVNFLVLVWLLKRFLYRPVMAVIARRQAAIDQSVADARAAEQRAGELRADYEARLAATDAAHAARLAELAEEIAAERRDRLARLDAEMRAEGAKRAALAAREAAESERRAAAAAHRQAVAFVARLLARLGDAHLDGRLLELLIEDLPALPPQQIDGLRAAAATPAARIAVSSARPLDTPPQRALEGALAKLLGRALPIDYDTDAALLGGLRVGIGPWLLAASLADELPYFSDGARRAG